MIGYFNVDEFAHHCRRLVWVLVDAKNNRPKILSLALWIPGKRKVKALQWRHNGCDNVSNHRPHDCLLNRLFRRRSKKTPKLRVTRICAGNSPGTVEFPAQMASYAENVFIWWRHNGKLNVDSLLHRSNMIDDYSVVDTCVTLKHITRTNIQSCLYNRRYGRCWWNQGRELQNMNSSPKVRKNESINKGVKSVNIVSRVALTHQPAMSKT